MFQVYVYGVVTASVVAASEVVSAGVVAPVVVAAEVVSPADVVAASVVVSLDAVVGDPDVVVELDSVELESEEVAVVADEEVVLAFAPDGVVAKFWSEIYSINFSVISFL